MDVILLGEISDLISGVNTNISNTKGSVDWGNGYLQNTIYPELITTRDHAVASNNNASGAYSYLANNVWPRIENNIWPTLANQIWPHLLQVYNNRDLIVLPNDSLIKTFTTGGSAIAHTADVVESQANVYNNNYWGETWVKQPGTYRIYATAGITLNSNNNTKNNNASGYWPSYANARCIIDQFHAAAGLHSSTNMVVCATPNNVNSGSAATTTATADIYLGRGDRVICYWQLEVIAGKTYNPCNTGYPLYNRIGCTLNAGEITMRGYTTEAGGGIVTW